MTAAGVRRLKWLLRSDSCEVSQTTLAIERHEMSAFAHRSLVSTFALLGLAGLTGWSLPLPAPDSCCCAPAHTNIVVTGTCSSCYVGGHDCGGSLLAQVHGAECRNQANATCTRSGSAAIAPEPYRCVTISLCGVAGETRCTYLQDGFADTGPEVVDCAGEDTECSGTTTSCPN